MSILIRMSALIVASSSPRSTDAEINELVRYSSFDIPEEYDSAEAKNGFV